MRKKYEILKLEKEDLVFSFDSAKRLFSLGIPMGLQFSIIAIGGIIVQVALNKLGANAVAAFSASSKVHGFITQMFPAIGVAIATFVGQNIGAGDYKRVKSGVISGIKLALICSVLAFAIVRIFGESLSASFISDPPKEVLQLNHIYFAINSWFYPFLCLIFVFRNAIQGMGDGVVPMISGTLELVARAAIIFLLSAPYGFTGICFADPLAWIFALIPLVPVFMIRMRKMLKRQKERELQVSQETP
ncbi:MAG TPA: hypothetical protein IAC41_06310 [Candidatus Merdenecus merdavium]|nr:hypothetical protein [Candidatus Merdenecus merdavium]